MKTSRMLHCVVSRALWSLSSACSWYWGFMSRSTEFLKQKLKVRLLIVHVDVQLKPLSHWWKGRIGESYPCNAANPQSFALQGLLKILQLSFLVWNSIPDVGSVIIVRVSALKSVFIEARGQTPLRFLPTCTSLCAETVLGLAGNRPFSLHGTTS